MCMLDTFGLRSQAVFSQSSWCHLGVVKGDVQQCWLIACSHPPLEGSPIYKNRIEYEVYLPRTAPALADGIPSVRLVLYCRFCCGLVRQVQDWNSFTLFTQHIPGRCICRYFCYYPSIVGPVWDYARSGSNQGWFLVLLIHRPTRIFRSLVHQRIVSLRDWRVVVFEVSSR